MSQADIKAWADQQFVPRYGFPIGLLRLRVLNFSETEKVEISTVRDKERAAISCIQEGAGS